MNAVFIRVDGGIRNEAARASAEMLRGGVAILAREAMPSGRAVILLAKETMPSPRVAILSAREAMPSARAAILIARETMPGAKVELPMARVSMMENLKVVLFHTGALPQASV